MALDLIDGKPRDLGGFFVRRVLPSLRHRSLGPFVFFDHLGPALLEPGEGIQVRPHPHIGLATVTFLFDGELVHRDSLGTVQSIRPGDVNWMTSGRGIVHSERSPELAKTQALPIHAIQSWVALPLAHEETAPSFAHHPAASLPTVERPGCRLTVIAGHAYGARAPVAVLAPTLYALVRMDAGACLELTDEHEERAAYLVAGGLSIDGEAMRPAAMAVFGKGRAVRLIADGATTLLLVGGAALDAPRALDWNFVASRRDAIAAARAAWNDYPNERFPQVPGETDFIPLPGVVQPPPTPL